MMAVGAPKKPVELVKVPVCVKLPQWLLDWLRDQPESNGVMIEEALCEKHGLIPPDVKAKTSRR